MDKTDVQVEDIEQGSEQLSPPVYLSVDLSDEERQKLESWIDTHLIQIEADMGPVLTRLQMERNQLDGIMEGADYPYPGAFRINMPVTKKKVREIVNRVKQAYLDSDPIWVINTKDDSLLQIAMKVEQALDFAMDNEIESTDDISQALFEAGLHGTGFIVPGWDYQEDVVRDVVSYKGYDNKTMESLSEVFRFENDFPNWRDDKEARKLHRQIEKGDDVNKEVTYTTAVRNKPEHTFVQSKDVIGYPSCNGIKGLRITPLYGYTKEYTKMELDQYAEDGIVDSDQLKLITYSENDEQNPRREMETFKVAHLTIRYRMKDEDRASRYKVWFERKSRKILRIRVFQFWINEPDLIPFYIRHEAPGLFKPGVAWDTLDDHTALNALLNLFLNAIDMANSMRWKAKENSLAYAHIINRQWSPHIPIPFKTDPREVESMATPTNHLGPIAQGLEMMRRNVDENTSTSALQSGRESPMDPSAPAAKTALLLQQMEPAIKEYIRSLESGFKLLGKWTLMLYYQALRLGWIESIPGLEDVPPETIKEIAEKLYPRAILFEPDRAGRQQRNLMLLQQTVAIFGNSRPDIVLKVYSEVVSQWDTYWSRIKDRLGLDMQLPAIQPQAPPEIENKEVPPNGDVNRIASMVGGR